MDNPFSETVGLIVIQCNLKITAKIVQNTTTPKDLSAGNLWQNAVAKSGLIGCLLAPPLPCLPHFAGASQRTIRLSVLLSYFEQDSGGVFVSHPLVRILSKPLADTVNRVPAL